MSILHVRILSSVLGLGCVVFLFAADAATGRESSSPLPDSVLARVRGALGGKDSQYRYSCSDANAALDPAKKQVSSSACGSRVNGKLVNLGRPCVECLTSGKTHALGLDTPLTGGDLPDQKLLGCGPKDTGVCVKLGSDNFNGHPVNVYGCEIFTIGNESCRPITDVTRQSKPPQ